MLDPRQKDYSKFNKAQKFLFMQKMLQQKEGALASALKRLFSLDDRTLRRYLSDFKEMELPIRTERCINEYGNRDRRIWIDASYQRSGVQISLLEWISLHFGRSLFNFLDGTNLSQDIDDALEKLSVLAGDSEQALTKDLDRKFMAVAENAKDHSSMTERIDDMLDALLQQKPAVAFYKKIGSPTRKYRLHPYTLLTYRQSLYLFAYDVDDGKIKTFALDRFDHFKPDRDGRFELPKDYHPNKMISDAFGIIGGTPVTVRLQFTKNTAPYIKERRWHHTQTIEPKPNGELSLSMNVALSAELKNWILGFGPEIRVLGPQGLKEEIKALHHKAAQQ